MRLMNKLIISVGIFVLIPSCSSNALYFYETEKISLTIEVRPDSSQPVQGNLGLKQRVVLITPAKGEDDGEALSVISSFRFKVTEKPGLNPVNIRTALITGDAANAIALGKEGEVAEAISLVNVLKKQKNAVSELEKLTNDELVKAFKCNGRSEEDAQRIAEKYKDLNRDNFISEFSNDYAWEAAEILNKYSKCDEI